MVYSRRIRSLDWIFVNKAILEKLAIVLSLVVVVVAMLFWVAQVGDVLETLCLAYGDWCFTEDP